MGTKNCDECKNGNFLKPKMECFLGHKPRFYMPKSNYPHFDNDWGYKRACIDYEEGQPKFVNGIDID